MVYFETVWYQITMKSIFLRFRSGSNLRRPPYSPPFACTATHPPVKPAPIWMSPYLAVPIYAPNSLHPPSKSRWNKQV